MRSGYKLEAMPSQLKKEAIMSGNPISHQTFTSLVSQLIGGYPSDRDPPPPFGNDGVINPLELVVMGALCERSP